MDCNRVPGPRPQFDKFRPRNLVFRQWARPALPMDALASAKANGGHRFYHVETAWEAMGMTPPHRERSAFARWSRK